MHTKYKLMYFDRNVCENKDDENFEGNKRVLRNERWIPLRYANNSIICLKWHSNEPFLKHQLNSTSNPANLAALFCPFLLSPSKIILISTIFLKPFHLVGKVQLFWEGHKILAHLTSLSNVKPLRKIAPNFCGFFRKAEL